MNKNIVGSMIAIAIIVTAILCITGSSDGADTENDKIDSLCGTIYEIPSKEDRKPLEGMTVTTWTSLEREFESTMTDENGYFVISYNKDLKYMTFEKDGYKIQAYCSELKANGSTGFYSIELKDESETGGVHSLMDDSGFTVIATHQSMPIHGNVKAVIDGTTHYLSGVTVCATYEGATRTATTNSEGYFSIDCEAGKEYKVTFMYTGFEDRVEYLYPSETSVVVTMTEKSHITIFGLDTTHMLALFCLLLIVLIALVAISITQKYKKGTSRITVVNDLAENKNEKD